MKKTKALAALLCLALLGGCAEGNADRTVVPTATSAPTAAPVPVMTVTSVSTTEETDDPAEESESLFASEEDKAAFELLGDYDASLSTYPTRHVELHITGESWEKSEDYELFREYFFGSWEKDNWETPLVIDDSESAWLAKDCHNSFLMDFYKVGEDVLVFQVGSAVGGALYWLDKNVPDTLYWADGAPGGSPNGIFSGEDGFPHAWIFHKSDAAANEPENNYLSVYRLREMAQKHGINYEMLVKFELADVVPEEVMWSGHDDRYYFYPMYLVSEADDRIEIKTQAGDVYSYAVDIEIILERVDGEWVRTIETAGDPNAYQLIGTYWDAAKGLCVDFSSIPTPENYDLFREYFFGVWDSSDGYLPWSLTLDDSENINFAGRGYFRKFYQLSDHVLAFTLHTNADAYVLWLDMDNPDIMYIAVCGVNNELYDFTLDGDTADVHTLTKNDAAPSEPSDGFLSIFKLHEMANEYGMDFDLLTYIDYGMIDGTHYLHSATYDFYPMYLVSEADDKIVIRTTVGNLMHTDLKPIEVICTFEKTDGEWTREVAEAR